MSRPRVYIAGPYTHPDPVVNTRRAVDVMHAMLDTGALTPVCPHLSMLAEFFRHRPIEEWYAYDLALLDGCHALWRLRGESVGADAEVAFAEERGIPVFRETDSMRDLLAWADEWSPPGLVTEDNEPVAPGMMIFSETRGRVRGGGYAPDGGVGASWAVLTDSDDPEEAERQARGGGVLHGCYASEGELRKAIARRGGSS